MRLGKDGGVRCSVLESWEGDYGEEKFCRASVVTRKSLMGEPLILYSFMFFIHLFLYLICKLSGK